MQIEYLEGTPVRGIAQLLRTGQCVLKRGSVSTLTQLGALKTEFGQIGSLVPNASPGQAKFRVADLVPLLRNNPGVDDELLTKIEAFVEKDHRGEVEYNVTIFDYGDDLVIKDGNKRTIAFFERRRESSNDAIAFPVFVVQPTGHPRAIVTTLTGMRAALSPTGRGFPATASGPTRCGCSSGSLPTISATCCAGSPCPSPSRAGP